MSVSLEKKEERKEKRDVRRGLVWRVRGEERGKKERDIVFMNIDRVRMYVRVVNGQKHLKKRKTNRKKTKQE